MKAKKEPLVVDMNFAWDFRLLLHASRGGRAFQFPQALTIRSSMSTAKHDVGGFRAVAGRYGTSRITNWPSNVLTPTSLGLYATHDADPLPTGLYEFTGTILGSNDAEPNPLQWSVMEFSGVWYRMSELRGNCPTCGHARDSQLVYEALVRDTRLQSVDIIHSRSEGL